MTYSQLDNRMVERGFWRSLYSSSIPINAVGSNIAVAPGLWPIRTFDQVSPGKPQADAGVRGVCISGLQLRHRGTCHPSHPFGKFGFRMIRWCPASSERGGESIIVSSNAELRVDVRQLHSHG